LTIRELAQLANVSPATVSIALNGKKGIGEDTRKRILKMAQQHNYSGAKYTQKKAKNVLVLKFWKGGMLVEENQSFISTIIDAIEGELRSRRHGLTMLISKEALDKTIDEINYNDYCGIIVIATEIVGGMYRFLDKIPIPFVVVDNTVPNYKYNSICVNNSENVYLALKCFKDNGHCDIGYLRSSIQTENFNERNEAFKKWVKVLEMNFESEQEYLLTPTLVDSYKEFKQILRIKDTMPGCLYADNDTIAIGAMKALREGGYKIPDDISIIGMDDIPFASVSAPALTTVRVQKEAIGVQAVKQLFWLINDQEFQNMKVSVTGDLIYRHSVKNLIKEKDQ